jgi:hypothetical protein
MIIQQLACVLCVATSATVYTVLVAARVLYVNSVSDEIATIAMTAAIFFDFFIKLIHPSFL